MSSSHDSSTSGLVTVQEDESAVLQVSGATIRYPDTQIPAVDRLDLVVRSNEAVGILGESGCGKTSLARLVTGLLPSQAKQSGVVRIHGKAISSEQEWRRIRGKEVGLVFQQPALTLHPMRRVGAQVTDVLRSRHKGSSAECQARASELFAELDLENDLLSAFPHQLSGGQRQRVVWAQALACEPSLLVADEPTTALDSETESQLLDWIDRIRRQRRLAMLWISHDPRVLGQVAHRLYIMYSGQWMEEGPVDSILSSPGHPYTRALLACRPNRVARAFESLEKRRLPVIPTPPETDAADRPGGPGCSFRSRCRWRVRDCDRKVSPRSETETQTRIWCLRGEVPE